MSKLTTVSQLAEELGIASSRIRQLLIEIREQEGEEVGQILGTVRVFSPADCQKLRRWHKSKRKYTK